MPFALPGQPMPDHIGRRKRRLEGSWGYVAPQGVISSDARYFASDGAMTGWYSLATYPPAIKTTDGRIWAGYQGWSWTNSMLLNRVRVYDPRAALWGDSYDALETDSDFDNHGVPALLETSDGRVHCFGGTHNGPMRHSLTTTPREPSTFVRQADIGSNYTYPHPVEVNGEIFLFLRRRVIAETRMPLVLVRSASVNPGTGVPTWTAGVELVNLGTDSRFYSSNFEVVGGKIHLMATYANYDDDYRRDTYYFVYDPATGSLSNLAGTVTVASGSLPLSLATVEASFRLVDQKSSGSTGNNPCFSRDGAGSTHIIYRDVASGGTTASVKVVSIVGGVTSAVTVLDTTDLGQSSVSIRTMDDGVRLEAWWTKENGKTYIGNGGDVWRARRNASGVWSAPERVGQAGDLYPLTAVSPVYKGTDLCAAVWTETIGTADTGVERGRVLRTFLHGDQGFVGEKLNPVAEAASYFSAMAVPEPLPTRVAANTFIRENLRNGMWPLVETINLNGTTNEQAALLDMTGRWVHSKTGGMAFVPGQGFAPDGVDDLLMLGVNPTTSPGVRMTQNSFAFGIWAKDGKAEIGATLGSTSTSGPAILLFARNTSNALNARANDETTYVGSGVTDGSGFAMVRRSSATQRRIVRNRTVATNTQATTGIVNGTLELFGSGATSRATRRVPLVIIIGAGSLTDPMMITIGNLADRLMDDLGITKVP